MPVSRSLNEFVEDQGHLRVALDKAKEQYRPYDQGWYLYHQVVAHENVAEKFSHDFIALVYATLGAWNMNSRGAKLAEFNEFKQSLMTQSTRMMDLANYRLESISSMDAERILREFVECFFSDVLLVAEGKPRLVTYSKTLHFFLPHLFMPVDRRYTLTFFYGNTDVPRSVGKQFVKFSEIFLEFLKFATAVQLQPFQDNTWNANIPKTIDNLIIGHLL